MPVKQTDIVNVVGIGSLVNIAGNYGSVGLISVDRDGRDTAFASLTLTDLW